MKKFDTMFHGGDVLTYKDLYDGEIIDFSSNINPLGPPEGLYRELIESFSSLKSYPDIKYRDLKESIGKYLKCDSENVVLGNGAVEIINNFIQLFHRVVVFLPSFSEYEKRGKVLGKEILKLHLNEEFRIDIQTLSDTLKEKDILVIGNPNNPTGLRLKKEEILGIYDMVVQKRAFLLLDEAFFEFSQEDYDSIELLKLRNFERAAIIRAATKFFSLPGIRLGYACTSIDMSKEYEEIELPWSINSMADCAGRYIFKCRDFIENSKVYINGEREFLLTELSKLDGIKVFHTESNYILIKLLNWNEDFVFCYFLKKGLLIRKCSSFEGLDKTYIRVAIKDRESNMKLVDVFKELESV